jgi:hypothetical protein
MRVLLDECVPRPFGNLLAPHAVSTVAKEGWKGVKNGALLRAAATEKFDAFVTVDRNIFFEQNLTALPVAVVILHAKTNRFVDLQPLASELLLILPTLQQGQLLHVPASAAP